jgi:general secretion pathway protein A
MYEAHFGLARPPFSTLPDPSNLYMTPPHREALAGLAYAIVRRKGFAVLVGEAGTGKTTLIRRTLEVIADLKPQACVVTNPVLTVSDFLEFFLRKLGVRDLPASRAQQLLRLEHVLIELQGSGRTPLLVVDEAHKLDFETLEEIRLLSNLEHGPAPLLQIILAGQLELDAKLNQPELCQLKQRIAVRLRLERLNWNQLNQYLAYRWTRSGGTTLPFTDEAISLIAAWSNGFPRLVNTICDNALLLAFSADQKTVGADEILNVVHDLDLKMDAHEPLISEHPLQRSARAHSLSGREILAVKTGSEGMGQ